MIGDYCGVEKARHYGPLFMILKQDVRMRTTFTNCDSGYSDGTDVATSEFFRWRELQLNVSIKVLSTLEKKKGYVCACYS